MFVCSQHERSSGLRGHIRLHHDEHSGALHGLRRGVGPHRSLCGHVRLLVEPQGNADPAAVGTPSPHGAGCFTAAVCFPAQVDNAYWLWTFQGRLLQKNNKDRFCQLLWRPRPPSLLSADQIKVNQVLGSVVPTTH